MSGAVNYPIIICVPDKFEDIPDLNVANSGLYALGYLLERALAVQGYKATMVYGGLDRTVILTLQKALDAPPHA